MSSDPIKHVLNALQQGRVTEAEADAYLRAKHSMSLQEARGAESKETVVAVLAAMLLLAGIAMFAFQGGITGFLVLDNPEGVDIPINDTITSLKVTGTMYGEGTADIYFDTPLGALLIGSLTSDDGSPRTDKASYALGDPVDMENTPENASYYFDDGTSIAVDIPFPAASGDLLIVTPDATYRLPIIIGERERETGFADLCVDTCVFEPTNGSVRVETTGTAMVSFSSISAEAVINTAPQLAVPFTEVLVDGNTTVNLSDHFTDVDGDALYYSTGTDEHVAAVITGDILLLTSLQTGNTSLMLYASDLRDLATVWLPLVVTMPGEEGLNATLNETSLNETIFNETILNETAVNETTNGTAYNATTNMNTTLPGLDCSSPDPNQRPLDCIQSNDSTFFRPEDLYLENRNAVAVGQITPIGNLLLRGTWIEHSTSSPQSQDWVRGYADEDGDFIPTAWIDTDTGDLHMRGTLTESNGNLVFESRYTAITNRRGIILVLIDHNSGDVVLRGNIIPYRRSFG
jgi:hypothetical protein